MLTSCPIPGKTYLTHDACFNLTTPAILMWVTGTGAYLFCDGIDVYRVWGMNKEMIAHHILGIMGTIFTAWIGVYIGMISEAMLVTELSSIFLNIMFQMKILKKEEANPKMKKYNSLSLMITFVGTRIIWASYLIIAVIIPVFWNLNYDKIIPVMGKFKVYLSLSLTVPLLLLCILNCFWAVKLWRGYKKS